MKRDKSSTLVVNDRAALNLRYRSALMVSIAADGFSVSSSGILGEHGLNWRLIFRLAISSPLVVVSNLRANLLVLGLWWVRGLVILNGMGRHRSKRGFRWLLVWLIRLNRRKVLAVQSYADYRYIRRYADHERCHWVIGSGGKRKGIGQDPVAVLVQRDDKLALVAQSARAGLRALAAHQRSTPRLAIVGCRGDVSTCFEGFDVRNIGFVPADQILSPGSVFLQPSGYGEGFPHSLADAIMSGMTLLISRREFLRYGLMRFETSFESIGDGWGFVRPSEKLIAAVAEPAVTARYLALLRLAI